MRKKYTHLSYILLAVFIAGFLSMVSFERGEAFLGRISPPKKIQIQAHPQGILLMWKSPRDKDVSGFRIYRYQSKKGPGVLIAELDATASSFVDSHVTSGTPSYYIVRTVSSSGKESKNKKHVAFRKKAFVETQLLPPQKTEQSLAGQFAELEKELLEAKTIGKNLAEDHSKRIKKDLDSLESRGYSSTEIERLRKLAQDLNLPVYAPAPPIAPASTETPAPSLTIPAQTVSTPSPSSSPPPAPAPTPPPSSPTTPPQAPTQTPSPPALNSWILPFSVGSAYDPATKSQGEISFAGEWVVRPFGGGRGANTWQPGNNLDIEFEFVPGTILRASASGKITFFKNPVSTTPSGETFDPQDWELHIQLGDGTYYIVYDHVIDIRVGNGETVQAGQAIARASPASIRHGGSQGQKPVDELEWGFRRASPQATGLCPWDYLTEAERAKFTSILGTMRLQGFLAGDSMCLKQEIPG